jgi:ABC-type multidrug transport system ATPase subunit
MSGLPPSAVEVRGLVRRFGDREALKGVDLTARPGEIHALLGPNGAGKTTLLRVLTGLVDPSEGSIRILGADGRGRAARGRVGLVPAGDRSFYLRISGTENLVFFARLHGMRKRAAVVRAAEVLDDVGLTEAANRPVGGWSHGMQKRLSVARALLTAPPVLLVDEATHDLDPEGAERIRALIADLATRNGAAVLWATQRLDEIRGFASAVTFLDRGTVRFAGSVEALMAHAASRRYVIRVRNGRPGPLLTDKLVSLLGERATVAPGAGDDGEHFRLEPGAGVPLGAAIAALADGGVDVLACRQERSEIEEAFLALTGGRP